MITVHNLREVCDIQSGGTPSRSKKEFWNGEVPWSKISDIEKSDGILLETEESITVEGLKAIRNRMFNPGTLLFAMYGSVGKAAIAGIEVSTNQAILGITVKDKKKLDMSYLQHWLGSQQSNFNKDARGVAQKNLSAGYVRDLKIPLPSLNEQKRIAAILDKADAIRRKRHQAIDLTDRLLRSVFLDMFGDPVTNPKGWKMERFANLGTWASGGTPSRKHKKYFLGDIDWYSAGELNTRYVDASIEKITKSAIKESAAKIFKSGSILLGMYDTAAFKSSILKNDSASNQACANLEPNSLISVEWFYTYIQIAKEHYLRLRRGVRQKNLNLGMIKEFELPLPSIDKQKEFEKICNNILKLSNVDNDYYRLVDLLFVSLMQQAFSGELSKQAKAA